MKPPVGNASVSAATSGAPRPVFPQHIDVLMDKMNSRRASLHQALEKQTPSEKNAEASAPKASTNPANFSQPSNNNFENKPTESVWLFLAQFIFNHWWKRHPARILLRVTKNTVLDQAQQHPGKVVAAGVVLGSVLVLLKPWRHLGGWGSLIAAGTLAAKGLSLLKTYRSFK
jgi:hypothetical protein